MKSLDGIQKMLGVDIAWLGEPPDAATLAERPKRRGGGRRGAAPARRDSRGVGRDGGRRERSEGRGPDMDARIAGFMNKSQKQA